MDLDCFLAEFAFAGGHVGFLLVGELADFALGVG